MRLQHIPKYLSDLPGAEINVSKAKLPFTVTIHIRSGAVFVGIGFSIAEAAKIARKKWRDAGAYT